MALRWRFLRLGYDWKEQIAVRLSHAALSLAVDQVTALTTAPQAALDLVQQRMQWKLDRVMRRWDAVKDERLKEWGGHDAR